MFQTEITYYLFTVLFLSQSSCTINNNTLILIVSFDGFRYDYFNRNISSTLSNLKLNSSHAPYMYSVFPTKTFPNHFSIATGLYTENHGVLDNAVFDRSTNKTLGYGYELFHYDEAIVPLWTLNERGGGGRRSGCMMWPGSDFVYQGTLPSHFMSYNASVSYENRVDTVLSWFTHPETPVNLAFLYFEEPDYICHKYGPNSKEVNKEIARADRTLKYLLNKTKDIGIIDRMNFIFLSDHGCQAVKLDGNIINLNEFVEKTWYNRDGVPPNLQIYPKQGKKLEVLEALRDARYKKGGNFSTFTKDEMLDRWHYKNCARTPPILITADVGYLFNSNKNYTVVSPEIGTHGYDPQVQTMWAFFMAMGPNFKKNYTVNPFENINIYPLAAHMLGLSLPAVKPNGTIAKLQDILATTTNQDEKEISIPVSILIIVSACIVIGIIFFSIRHCKTKQKKLSTASYRNSPTMHVQRVTGHPE